MIGDKNKIKEERHQKSESLAYKNQNYLNSQTPLEVRENLVFMVAQKFHVKLIMCSL